MAFHPIHEFRFKAGVRCKNTGYFMKEGKGELLCAEN